MFPFFPFTFLVPLLFFFLVVRLGMRLFRDYFQDDPHGDRRFHGFPGSGAFLGGGSGGHRLGRPSPEARVFRLAYKLRGRITVSDLVLETGMGIQEAEEMLNSLIDGMRICMEVNEKGMVVYEFPEIIARFEGGTDA